MYLEHLWPELDTSSLLSGRVFGNASSSKRLVGTWAHEGPMAFMAMYGQQLDRRLPVSSVLWTVLFWGITGNHTILPDAAGSATYKYMLRDLGLLEDVAIARQDSGTLDRFASIFKGWPIMASEIETFADIQSALDLGYTAFGAGGFFGEKRKSLGTEFSIAAKLTKASREGEDGKQQVGYAGKLGDFSGGSWAEYNVKDEAKAKAKFIVSPEVNSSAIFKQLLGFAVKGAQAHDLELIGQQPPPIMEAADISSLLAELGRISAAPCFSLYPEIRSRLQSLTEKMNAGLVAVTIPGR